VVTSPAGLRERKKTATRQALQLWLDQPEASLVEMVREALAVSRERFR
jgi:hypothetical protein